MIIKEVHSLLATEVLLSCLPCRVVFLLRNPIVIIDSLLNYYELRTIYLRYESKRICTFFDLGVNSTYFEGLENVFEQRQQTKDNRVKKLLELFVTISFIHRYLTDLSLKYSNTLLINYEDILDDRDACFSGISGFLGLYYEPGSFDFSRSPQTHNSPDNDIARNDSSIFERQWKALTASEVSLLQHLASNILD